jgi:hypothetical protein
MTQDDPARIAAELATRIVSARVGAAAGRPNTIEGRELAGYFRTVLGETRRALGLPPIPEPEAGAGEG